MASPRRQYDLARHHAWGGLAFLALLAALRGIFPGLPSALTVPLLAALAAYAAFWLVLTYRYRAALVLDDPDASSPAAAKTRVKLAKKRAKAEAKARKKSSGNREP